MPRSKEQPQDNNADFFFRPRVKRAIRILTNWLKNTGRVSTTWTFPDPYQEIDYKKLFLEALQDALQPNGDLEIKPWLASLSAEEFTETVVISLQAKGESLRRAITSFYPHSPSSKEIREAEDFVRQTPANQIAIAENLLHEINLHEFRSKMEMGQLACQLASSRRAFRYQGEGFIPTFLRRR